MDETCIKVKGPGTYLYRAVDRHGKTPDVMLSERRDEAATPDFFAHAIGTNGWPDKVVIDKSGTNLAGLGNLNGLLILQGWFWLIEVCQIKYQVKYMNNMIEYDQRFIQKLTRPMKGFKSFRSASAAFAGIEVAHMIHKSQFAMPGKSAFQQFAELAA